MSKKDNFKLYVHDVARYNAKIAYIAGFSNIMSVMTPGEIIQYHKCYHLMEYKLLLNKIENRLQNEQCN